MGKGFLLWFCLANTAKIMHSEHGRKFVQGILQALDATAPGKYLLDATTVNGLKCDMVKNRGRVEIRGALRFVVPGYETLPRPLDFTLASRGPKHQFCFWNQIEILNSSYPQPP